MSRVINARGKTWLLRIPQTLYPDNDIRVYLRMISVEKIIKWEVTEGMRHIIVQVNRTVRASHFRHLTKDVEFVRRRSKKRVVPKNDECWPNTTIPPWIVTTPHHPTLAVWRKINKNET